MTIQYLDRDHPAFDGRPHLLTAAGRAVLRLGLDLASRYRLEFDEHHLRASLSGEAFAAMVPEPDEQPTPPWHYRVIEANLDPTRRALLLDTLFPEQPGGSTPGVVAIRSLRLLDTTGLTLVRVGDHGTFTLFDLPLEARGKLAQELQRLNLPSEVSTPVDVDSDKLHP